jgi:hypothetical protein
MWKMMVIQVNCRGKSSSSEPKLKFDDFDDFDVCVLRYKVDQGEIPTPQIRRENCVDFRGKMGKMTRFPLILLDAPNASTEVPLLATFEGTAQDRDFLQVKKSDELSWIIK